MMLRVFISSVQKELAEERRTLKNYILNDPLLKRFISEVFLFEYLPASDHRADDVYLEEVEHCDVYVGLFGMEYGKEDYGGFSPTEREFDHATAKGKTRLVFVKGSEDKGRHPKMIKLIHKAGLQLIRRRFNDIPDLTSALYAGLVEYLEGVGKLQTLPFDAAACPRASMGDLPREKIKWFLVAAKRERNYPLPVKTDREKALAHLNLLDGRRPSHAAVLLFGSNPQRFLPTSEVKCMHFHGTEVRKPILSYQIFKGTLFELVDQAADFVMSKINRSVGTRSLGPQAPVEYELPIEAVTEAVVNAVAHRDYASNASVRIILFADRLEVWNPGELPPSLTPERLRKPHASIPRNPLVAEPLYLARYIEKAGSGTLDMIEKCSEARLPAPDFEERAGQFVTTIWRDWLTDRVLTELGLNDRQERAVVYLKTHQEVTNSIYQLEFRASKRTASRDLDDMTTKGIIEKIGITGKGVRYRLVKGAKGAMKCPYQSKAPRRGKRGNFDDMHVLKLIMWKGLIQGLNGSAQPVRGKDGHGASHHTCDQNME